MATSLKLRRGTTTAHGSFTGAEAEVTVDTTKDTVVVHDGSTAGGFPLLREDLSNNTNVTTNTNTQTLTNKTLSAPSVSGNLTFTGTGNRITGDFSNATIANRVMFQSSTTNVGSNLGLLPNGTAGGAFWNAYGSSDPTNAAEAKFGLANNSEVTIRAAITGTGTYLPMTFYTGGSERMRIDTSGNVGIGRSSPYSLSNYTALSVGSSATQQGMLMLSDGTTNYWSYANSSGAFTGTVSNHSYKIQTNNTTRMIVDTSGNVGIGTSSIAERLTVSGNIRIEGSNQIQLYDSNYFIRAVTGLELQSADLIRFLTNSTERMRIDSSGNVGIGGAPNELLDLKSDGRLFLSLSRASTNATEPVIQGYKSRGTQASKTIVSNSDSTLAIRGAGYDGTSFYDLAEIKYVVDGTPSTGVMPGRIVFSTNAGGTATTERMRITSGGQVAVGFSGGGNGQLTSYANIAFEARNAGTPYYQMYNSSAGTDQKYWRFGNVSGAFAWETVNDAYSSATERMRIDSSGNLLVGTTSQPVLGNERFGVVSSSGCFGFKTTGGTVGGMWLLSGSAASSGVYVNFYNGSGGTQVGNITSNGTTTAYNTSSDYRLKENIVDLSNALETVAKLKPRQFDWKETGDTTTGFIAHELQAVVPDCVTGEKDAVDADGNPVYQGIDTSFLVATLTAAIKEQQELIKQLQADVALLKGN